ncbi:MAG: DUF2769 domain-containing protein [Actinobacteria bacterium]|nr:MAG: DUF2769 domain-containing protein [Actinomycetota bacterium]
MAKVEYNSENCMQCMCGSCPVQAQSQCTLEKRGKWLQMQKEMNQMMMQEKMGTQTQMKEARGGMSMPMAQEQEMGMEMEMLKPDEMIGLYCSSQIGKSGCANDLDTNQKCSCPTCMVWMRHDLNAQYYCSEGDADQRG